MSDLIVLTFDDVEAAQAVRRSFQDLSAEGAAKVIDSAVISRDASGDLNAHDQVSSGTKAGAVGGATVGLLMGMILPPLGFAVAIAGGAAAGAVIGRDLRGYVDKAFVKEVEEALTPGQSALFLLVDDANVAAVAGALRGHRGSVYQTTFEGDAEETIRQAIGERT
jgi:uncharacterized membrane protein